MTYRSCAVCGKPFVPKSWNQKTCSPGCSCRYRQKHNREYQRKYYQENLRRRVTDE